jgi:SH3-like domain-containing protein
VAAAVLTLMAAGAGWSVAASGWMQGLGDRAPVMAVAQPVPVAEVPVMAATVLPVAVTAPDGGVPTVSTAVPTAGDSVRWVPAVARTWVNVRRDASRDGEVVGVIKPESRAWLEHGRAGWRRVRAQDVRGWVDPRLFEADSVARRGG